jgi:hypothetical protein
VGDLVHALGALGYRLMTIFLVVLTAGFVRKWNKRALR